MGLYFDEAPKQDRGSLYNFEPQLTQFLRLLKDGARLIPIVGLRRTGKTSLLLTGLDEADLPHLVIDGR